MDPLFRSSETFSSLSIKDLAEARDLFHYHLLNKKNVVGTALGLYRIRMADPWPSKDNPSTAHKRKEKSEPRTLSNSEVRPYSWPCVYVFVSRWEFEVELSRTDPSDVVPRSLLLPDGRSVPVCVIEAPLQGTSKDLQVDPDALTPRNVLGPGTALVNRDGQGMPRLATAGCLVRDGERYFVLTNKHAIGAAGTPIEAVQVHRQARIGQTAAKALTREDFATVYPRIRSTNQRLLMDVGLVDVDDVLQWKSDVPGIEPIGPVLDLYDNSLTLKLITMKVIGRSAVSGLIRGEIHGLFYRYKALGGSEYIADFLIGPPTHGVDVMRFARSGSVEKRDPGEQATLAVHHGDSGTLLFVEQKGPAPDAEGPPTISYRPFALLWGKEEFGDRVRQSQPYALATSLSTALDRLDLDFVRDLNSDQTYIWGWVGHYTIGRALPAPTDLVTSPRLRAFIANNLDLLSIQPDAALGNNPHVVTGDDSTPSFVALADVPDNVWKSNVNFTMVDDGTGKKRHQPGPGSRGQHDNPNHFADLDLPYQDGKTFLQLNLESPDSYLNPRAWIAYFAAMKPRFDAWDALLGGGRNSKHWGALPFRVHQLFDVMVAAAKAKDAELFLCAGGVLIHYLGDACQPLHASYLSQGDPERVVSRPHSSNKKLEADGVHSGYEDDMIAYGHQEKGLGVALETEIKALAAEPVPRIASGYDASKAVIELISRTQQEISPRAIVDRWVQLIGTPRKQKSEAMWDSFGSDTVTCLARGTRYLAAIWQAAWKLGDGDQNLGTDGQLDPADLMRLYEDPDVMPSVALDQYPDDANTDWSRIKRPAA